MSVRLAARALAVSALGFTLVPVLGANPAYACSCIQSTEQENYERADVVFKGTMNDVEATNRQSGDRTFFFAPSTTYKGKTTDPQEVSTAGNSAACGVDLTGGGPFLVFANFDEEDEKGELRTSLCSGTREIGANETPDFKAHGATSDGRVYKGGAVDEPAGPATPMDDGETRPGVGTTGGGSTGGSDPRQISADPDADPGDRSAPDSGPNLPVSIDEAPVTTTAAEDTPLMQTTGIAQDSAAGESAAPEPEEAGPNAMLTAAAGLAGLGALAAVGAGLYRRRQSGA
ncbi:MAG: hypothetical protein ACT4QF_11055 [Sporichthyaceae bacterium]